jgi:hypothetical protein
MRITTKVAVVAAIAIAATASSVVASGALTSTPHRGPPVVHVAAATVPVLTSGPAPAPAATTTTTAPAPAPVVVPPVTVKATPAPVPVAKPAPVPVVAPPVTTTTTLPPECYIRYVVPAGTANVNQPGVTTNAAEPGSGTYPCSVIPAVEAKLPPGTTDVTVTPAIIPGG